MKRQLTTGLMSVLVFLVLGIALTTRPATAYIERLYSLQEIMNESTHILVAVVESVDKEKQRATLRVVEDLKGTSGWKKININFAVGQFDHPALMMKRLAPGLPALMFYQQQGGSFAAETHCFGSWFQTHTGDGPDRDNVWWNFTHIEIHLQRTYSGPTPAFIQLVKDVLAKKKDPPAANPQQASGPGPELPAVIPASELWQAPGTKPPAVAKGGTPKPVKPVKPEAPAAPPAIPAAAGPALAAQVFDQEITVGTLPGPVLGVSWVDYDGDGDADAYTCSTGGNRLYRNAGNGTLADVTTQAGLSGGSRSAAWADYNNDGRPDLVLDTPKLFTNTGERFRDDTKQLPPTLSTNTGCAAWIDADANGRPDLLFGCGAAGLTLLQNTGKMPAFQDASKQIILPKGTAPAVRSFLTVADVDADGRADVLCGLQEFLVLLNRQPGGLVARVDTGLRLKTDPAWPVGTAAGDFDNDGLVDVFVPQRGGGRLFRNRGKGLFEDVTERSPDLAKLGAATRAGCWFDVNGDGCLDLYVATEQGAGRLFANDRSGILHDRTQATGLAGRGPGGGAAGVAAADFDGDGDQDLLMGSRSGRVLIHRNNLKRSPAHAFLQVRLERLASGLGARVDLHSTAGKLLAHREVSGGDNFGSQGDLAAFFPAKPGTYQLRLRLSDGRALTRPLEVPAGGLRLNLDQKSVADARPEAPKPARGAAAPRRAQPEAARSSGPVPAGAGPAPAKTSAPARKG
jgi:VCBS repeat protein/FG-GAP repeat protein